MIDVFWKEERIPFDSNVFKAEQPKPVYGNLHRLFVLKKL